MVTIYNLGTEIAFPVNYGTRGVHESVHQSFRAQPKSQQNEHF